MVQSIANICFKLLIGLKIFELMKGIEKHLSVDGEEVAECGAAGRWRLVVGS